MSNREIQKSGRKPGKVYARAVVALLLLFTWGLAALAGVLLFLAPEGMRSGHVQLLFGLTKHGWRNLHFGLSLLAIFVTVVHLTLDWKALTVCVHYLVSTNRNDLIAASPAVRKTGGGNREHSRT